MSLAVREIPEAHELGANGRPRLMPWRGARLHNVLDTGFQFSRSGRHRGQAEGTGTAGQAMELMEQALRQGGLPVGRVEPLVLAAKVLQLVGKRFGKPTLQLI